MYFMVKKSNPVKDQIIFPPFFHNSFFYSTVIHVYYWPEIGSSIVINIYFFLSFSLLNKKSYDEQKYIKEIIKIKSITCCETGTIVQERHIQ